MFHVTKLIKEAEIAYSYFLIDPESATNGPMQQNKAKKVHKKFGRVKKCA